MPVSLPAAQAAAPKAIAFRNLRRRTCGPFILHPPYLSYDVANAPPSVYGFPITRDNGGPSPVVADKAEDGHSVSFVGHEDDASKPGGVGLGASTNRPSHTLRELRLAGPLVLASATQTLIRPRFPSISRDADFGPHISKIPHTGRRTGLAFLNALPKTTPLTASPQAQPCARTASSPRAAGRTPHRTTLPPARFYAPSGQIAKEIERVRVRWHAVTLCEGRGRALDATQNPRPSKTPSVPPAEVIIDPDGVRFQNSGHTRLN